MKRPNNLTTKLKACDLEIYDYVMALEEKIAKLQKEIAKLAVENVSFQQKVKILEKMRPINKFIVKGR
jgi:uncharacterized small protein (DUF1192 family)